MHRYGVKFSYDVVTVDVLDERLRAQECGLCPLVFLPGQRVAKIDHRYSAVTCYLHLECMAQLVVNDPEAIENRFAEMRERIERDVAAEAVVAVLAGEGFQVAESRSRRNWVDTAGQCAGCLELVWTDQGYFHADGPTVRMRPSYVLFHDGCSNLEPSRHKSPHPRSASPVA